MLILASVMKSFLVTDPLKITVIRSSTGFTPTAYTNSFSFFKSPTAVITEDSTSCCRLELLAADTFLFAAPPPPSTIPKSPPQNNSSNENPPARQPSQLFVIQPNMPLSSFSFLLASACASARASIALFSSCNASILSCCRSNKLSRALNVASCLPSSNTSLSSSPSFAIIFIAVLSGSGRSRMRIDWAGLFNTPFRAKSRSSASV
mmetsp:Transcript_26486/g.47747  ORF Transcript_26486/g.47747 Transcript_26486/m.47747 type:complete len:206 (+) Transcript_26486:962-1579(+)